MNYNSVVENVQRSDKSMSKDIATYNARVMNNYLESGIQVQQPVDIVFDILLKSSEALKREEIIKSFQKRQQCEDLYVDDIVSSALAQLEKKEKIVRLSQGIYKVI